MACSPFLDDFVEQAVLVAVHKYSRYMLHMSTLFPLFPNFFAASAIEMGKSGACCEPDCFTIGIRDHQHLSGCLVLDNDGDKTVLVT